MNFALLKQLEVGGKLYHAEKIIYSEASGDHVELIFPDSAIPDHINTVKLEYGNE
jgi:hypothetical protein